MRRQKILRKDSSANQGHNHTFPISSLRYKDFHPAIGKTLELCNEWGEDFWLSFDYETCGLEK